MPSVHPLNRIRTIRGRRALAAWIADPDDHPGNPELYFDGELAEQRIIRVLADLQHFRASIQPFPVPPGSPCGSGRPALPRRARGRRRLTDTLSLIRSKPQPTPHRAGPPAEALARTPGSARRREGGKVHPMRFEAVPTMTGAEVFDSIRGRVVDVAPSMKGAQRAAARLNRLLDGEPESRVIRLLARETFVS